ncbi:hypothetical protein [Azospirillum agricola]|uniref:hypothetical protein n=1 Tax=Azospirillum agricola TaxID=1720247 RepID=UPI000A0F0DC3|nr:hypothetical protein [Azospirillum agricola]SMH58844.1 hypothetical protein SAMN02982994_4799 [Azospirillum lipoferum]
MTVMDREIPEQAVKRQAVKRQADERARRLRGRNYAVLAALLALAVLFYAITVVRMGVGH